MSHESFNIKPGMSAWVDMTEEYKSSYYDQFAKPEPIPEFKLELPKEFIEEVKEEVIIELEEEVTCSCGMECHCDDVVENPCPVCGNELPKGKKYCTKECFYNRFKI